TEVEPVSTLEDITPAARSARAEPVPSSPFPLEACLQTIFWLWLGGSVVWFCLAGLRICRFHRLLAYAQLAPPCLQGEVQQSAGQPNLCRCPTVWLLPGPGAPLVWAAGGRARLFFPANLIDRLDKDGRTTLFLHELAHVRRRDHWVRWLEFVAMGLYWWY